jgi:hypothetical protein
MDYTVYRDPKSLDSTGYMEIGPGKYSGQHWQEGFLFIWEDAFSIAEGIIVRNFPEYDHFGMNDIPRFPGLMTASDLRRAACALGSAKSTEASGLLFIPDWLITAFTADLAGRRDEMQAMLTAIADVLEQAYRSKDHVCILGM